MPYAASEGVKIMGQAYGAGEIVSGFTQLPNHIQKRLTDTNRVSQMSDDEAASIRTRRAESIAKRESAAQEMAIAKTNQQIRIFQGQRDALLAQVAEIDEHIQSCKDELGRKPKASKPADPVVTPAPPVPPSDGLDDMSKGDLVAMAEGLGLEMKGFTKKGTLIEMIRTAQKA